MLRKKKGSNHKSSHQNKQSLQINISLLPLQPTVMVMVMVKPMRKSTIKGTTITTSTKSVRVPYVIKPPSVSTHIIEPMNLKIQIREQATDPCREWVVPEPVRPSTCIIPRVVKGREMVRVGHGSGDGSLPRRAIGDLGIGYGP